MIVTLRIPILVIVLFSYLVSPSPLKAEFDPHIKCGFNEGNLLNKAANSSVTRPILTHSLISPDGWFKIHYNVSGSDAIDATDSLLDGTPRFPYEAGIAADSAYHVLVDILGFQAPVTDNIDGPQYDIYIKDYHGTLYGETLFTATNQPAYLVVDNNFSENGYYTHGLQALRVTVVHEFFHMVQVHYSLPSPISYQYWFEMSSVWFEEYCYPDVNDYLAYTVYVFNSNPMPRLNDDSIRMYGQGLFPYVLDKAYGFSGGKHIMTDIWEQLGSRDPIQNLKTVLASARWNSSSLQEALSLYGLYNTFTGERGQVSGLYPDAAVLPTIPYADVNIVLDGERTDSYSVPPLSIFYNRYLISGIGTIYLTNETAGDNPTAAQLAVGTLSGDLSLSVSLTPNMVKSALVNSGTVLYLPTANASTASANPMIIHIQTNALDLATAFQTIFPNPVSSDHHKVTCDLILGKPGVVTGKIYNILGQELLSRNFELVEGQYGLDLTLPDNLPSGIYFARLITPDGIFTHKFTFIH